MILLFLILFVSCERSEDDSKASVPIKDKEILLENPDVAPIKSVLSEVASLSSEHEYKISNIYEELEQVKNLEAVSEKEEQLRLSIFNNINFKGSFLSNENSNEYLAYFPCATLGSSKPLVGLRANLCLENMVSNLEVSMTNLPLYRFNLLFKINRASISFFSGDAQLPSSSDFLVSYYSPVAKPREGFLINYSFAHKIYRSNIVFLLGSDDSEQNVFKSDVLLTLDNKFSLDNGVDFNFNINYFDEIVASSRTEISLEDRLSSSGIPSLDSSIFFKTSFPNLSFVRLSYLTSVNSMENATYGASGNMSTVPILRLAPTDAILLYTDVDLDIFRIRAGIFEAGQYFNDSKSNEKEVFANSFIKYKKKSAASFIEASMFEGKYVSPKISYTNNLKDSKYLISLSSHFRIMLANLYLSFGIMQDSYKVEGYGSLYDFNFKSLVKFSDHISIFGSFFDYEVGFLDFNYIKASVLGLEMMEDKGITLSVLYSNFGIGKLVQYFVFDDSDFVELGMDIQKKGKILYDGDIVFHLHCSLFKYNLFTERLSSSFNFVYGYESSESLFGIAFNIRYLIAANSFFEFNLGRLSGNRDVITTENFLTSFPKSGMKFNIEKENRFELKLESNFY